MKQKISSQELANYLAQNAECDLKEAESFVRAFFDVIEAGLLQDKFVKIKGFGTFKLVAVSERESVNINTGERFQIDGHTKISFTPDSSMKELVNRPFAHFESVDLSEETDIKEFENVDKQMEIMEEKEKEHTAAEEEQKSQETAEEEKAEVEEPTPSDSSETETAEETPAESSSEEAEKIVPETPTPAPIPPIEIKKEEETETNEEPQPEKEEAETPMTVTLVKAEEEDSEEKQEEEPQEAPKDDAEDTPAAAESQEIVVKGPSTITEEAEEEKPSPYSSEKFSYTYTEKPPHKKRNVWKTVAIILGLILLMVICYFAGYFRVLCPCSYPFIEKWGSPEVEYADTISHLTHADSVALKLTPDSAATATGKARKDSASANPKKTAQPAQATNSANGQQAQNTPKPDAKQAAKEKPAQPAKQDTASAKTNTTKPAYHVVRLGDNVYKISRKYYGSDKYVPAIIKLNNLHDANNIVVGKRIKLP